MRLPLGASTGHMAPMRVTNIVALSLLVIGCDTPSASDAGTAAGLDASPPIDAAAAADATGQDAAPERDGGNTVDAELRDAASPDAFDCDSDDNGLCDDIRIGFWGAPSAGGAASFGAFVDPNLEWRAADTSSGSALLGPSLLSSVDVVVIEQMRDPLTGEESGELELFVRRGGGVVVMSGYEAGNTHADAVANMVGLQFDSSLYSGPVLWTEPHPIHAGLPSSFESFGGYAIVSLRPSDARTTLARTSPASGAAADFVVVAAYDSGRLLLVGDENLTLDRAWGPDSQRFWVQALTWAAGR